jgi:hypothetical protein
MKIIRLFVRRARRPDPSQPAFNTVEARKLFRDPAIIELLFELECG